jgi:glycosyltransferase involved in cell wall biosynthesis
VVAVSFHNIEYTIWDRYASVLSNLHPKKWYILNQAKKLREEESHFYHQADVCFAITEADKTRANQLARGANVCVATAGVNLDEWNPLPNISKENALMVLATNYDWIHNVDGAIWFIKEVLPLVIKQYPNAKLQLIGKNPPDALKQLQSNSVEVLGFVPSVKEYLSRANIYVAPLFVGGGIRIKILEAMAMHLPVVATSVSAEGIVAGEADGLFRADSASATSNVIIKLLDDKTLASERGAAAAEFISQNHTWKQCVGIMSDCLLSIVKK